MPAGGLHPRDQVSRSIAGGIAISPSPPWLPRKTHTCARFRRGRAACVCNGLQAAKKPPPDPTIVRSSRLGKKSRNVSIAPDKRIKSHARPPQPSASRQWSLLKPPSSFCESCRACAARRRWCVCITHGGSFRKYRCTLEGGMCLSYA
jgi:hypothetical protein